MLGDSAKDVNPAFFWLPCPLQAKWEGDSTGEESSNYNEYARKKQKVASLDIHA